jgi:solute carrier family 25 S-adenosylmethionine transporter 26
MVDEKGDLCLWEHLVAGGGATLSAVSVMHPLDTIKIYMQRAQVATAGGSANVRPTMLGAAQEILAQRGPGGFYAGLGANLSGQVPAGAIKFATYELLKQHAVQKRLPAAAQGWGEVASAALAFLACSVVLVPGEVVKSRLQAGLYPSFREALLRIIEQDGVSGLYRGYWATVTRDVPYTMLEFGLYEQFKRACMWSVKRDRLHSSEEWTMGGLAGGVTGWCTTPLDVIKTKLMTCARSQYRGYWDAARDVWQREGLSGFFTGGLARVLWLVPFTAVFFGSHEIIKRFLRSRKRQYSTLRSTRIPRMDPEASASSNCTCRYKSIKWFGSSTLICDVRIKPAYRSPRHPF